MDIEWIETFLIAAEEGNFHRASERLNFAQPTVSLHIRKLEAYWGVRLFDRDGRGVRLSAAGVEAVPFAQQILSALKDSQSSLAMWRERYRDRLIIAASPIVAHTYLPRWIHRLHAQLPHIQAAVQVAESDDVWDRVISRRADIGFARRGGQAASIHTEVLYEDPTVFVAPADAWDHDGPLITMADVLERYTLVTGNHPLIWPDVLAQLRRRFPWFRTMEVSRTDITLHFVEQGLAASILPLSVVRSSLSLGRVVEIESSGLVLPMTHTYMLWHEEAREAASSFRGLVRTYMSGR